jgi:hypothetical protein
MMWDCENPELRDQYTFDCIVDRFVEMGIDRNIAIDTLKSDGQKDNLANLMEIYKSKWYFAMKKAVEHGS